MAIKTVERRICDIGDCERESGPSDPCPLCGRDFCLAQHHVNISMLGYSLWICSECAEAKIGEVLSLVRDKGYDMRLNRLAGI